jgi:hypothetical protein
MFLYYQLLYFYLITCQLVIREFDIAYLKHIVLFVDF